MDFFNYIGNSMQHNFKNKNTRKDGINIKIIMTSADTLLAVVLPGIKIVQRE